MRKLEEFVFEKLKVTNKSCSIHTTLRKFLAWYDETDEFSISKFNIEIRDFISSDESMSKRKITDFLYKHIDDKIDVNEEESREIDGLKSRLYNYSFDIEDITFSINARIFNDSELLSHSKDYILEKLKVSKNNSDLLQLEFRNFVTWYMYDTPDWTAGDLKSVKFAEDTTNKYFNRSYKQLYDFINKHEHDIIYVSEKKIPDNERYIYSFKVDEIPFNVEAFMEDESELLSKQWRILIEKLKVSKNSNGEAIKSTMKGFFEWYFGDSPVDDYYQDIVYALEFNNDNDIIKRYFNNNMDKFRVWFKEHMNDIIYIDEVKVDKENYEYTFSCDGIEFLIVAWLGTPPSLFSKSKYVIKNLHEKLRVSNNPIKDNIKSTMKRFFLWYWDYTEDDTIIGDFWTSMEQIKFANDAIESNFKNKNEFLDWFEKHMYDIVYFDEVKLNREDYYEYTFSCDGIDFVIDAWLSESSTLFSKSQYVFKNVH